MKAMKSTRLGLLRMENTAVEVGVLPENINGLILVRAGIFMFSGFLSQVRRIDAEKKFDELKKGNNLDKYMKRKAKKEAAKQKKSRPPFEGYGFQ
uniref:Uncharacterized protein n=1 Tax=Caenorhabditis japonica TaxID=281687 RepID=A0A8R1IP36_CAEJA